MAKHVRLTRHLRLTYADFRLQKTIPASCHKTLSWSHTSHPREITRRRRWFVDTLSHVRINLRDNLSSLLPDNKFSTNLRRLTHIRVLLTRTILMTTSVLTTTWGVYSVAHLVRRLCFCSWQFRFAFRSLLASPPRLCQLQRPRSTLGEARWTDAGLLTAAPHLSGVTMPMKLGHVAVVQGKSTLDCCSWLRFHHLQ